MYSLIDSKKSLGPKCRKDGGAGHEITELRQKLLPPLHFFLLGGQPVPRDLRL